MINPTFSIIIPCYNVEDYVEIAIDSCLSQIDIENDEFELIIINDGSTDSTINKLEKYRVFKNIKIIDQENRGLSAARNRGLSAASGDYILFLDSDDWFKVDALSVLKKNLTSDVILFPLIYYYDDTNIVNNSIGNLVEGEYTPQEILQFTIGASQFQSCPAPSKCYKRTFLLNNNICFIEGILHEDGPFFLEVLAKVNSVRYISEFFYYYRQKRSQSITTQKRTWRNAESIFLGNKYVFNIYKFSNRHVCYYYIATMIMQLYSFYASHDDEKKVLTYMGKLSTRKFLLNSLVRCVLPFRDVALCLLAIFAPRFGRLLHDINVRIR